MFHSLRRKASTLGLVTLLAGAGIVLTAIPASATVPVISSSASCVDGHTRLAVSAEPIPGHTFTKGNTWGALIADFTAVPAKLGSLGLGVHTLHVQVSLDNGSFTHDFVLVVNPLPSCETSIVEEVTTTAATVSDTTTAATEPPTVPTEVTTTTTAAPAVIVADTTTTTQYLGVLDASETKAAELPATGASVATLTVLGLNALQWVLVFLLVGTALVLIAWRRHSLPTAVRTR